MVLAAATEDVAALLESVAVAMARVRDAAVDEAVVSVALAFLLPQVAASLQAF